MTKPQWIKIKTNKDLPKPEKFVLVSDGKMVDIASCILVERNPDWEDIQGLSLYDVTHWMPLPEPPEES